MMPNPTPELPEDIRKDIDNYMAQNHPFVWPKNKHGEDMVQPVGHVHPPFWRKHQNQIAPIRAAAEHYAALYLEAERRLKIATDALERIRDTRSIIGNPLEIRRIIEEALALFPVDKKKEDAE